MTKAAQNGDLEWPRPPGSPHTHRDLPTSFPPLQRCEGDGAVYPACLSLLQEPQNVAIIEFSLESACSKGQPMLKAASQKDKMDSAGFRGQNSSCLFGVLTIYIVPSKHHWT